MLGIEKVDHVGIRVSDKSTSVAFYERLGFRTLSDTGFEEGHPIIMEHPSGVVLNLLGPADMPNDRNILMDADEKYPGITHVSFRVASIDDAKGFLADRGIPLSGQFSFKDLRAVFIPRPRPQRHRARCLRGGGTGGAGRRRRTRRLSGASIVTGPPAVAGWIETRPRRGIAGGPAQVVPVPSGLAVRHGRAEGTGASGRR